MNTMIYGDHTSNGVAIYQWENPNVKVKVNVNCRCVIWAL